MSIANRGDLDRIQYLQAQARKGYAKGAAAAAATFIMSPLSVPTIIALCGSGLIYHGLENYSDRRMAGQSELESRTGSIVDTITLGTYPLFKGRDAGTGDKVSDELKLKIVSDLIPYTIGGAVGIVSGSLFSRLNPSTSQLMDEAFANLNTTSNKIVLYDPEFASMQLFGRELKIGTVSSEQMRALYDPKVKLINIDLPPTRANAEFIHALRNAYKRLARALMADRAAAARLDKNYPLHPIDYYMKKYSEQGFSGEALWRRIMEGGKTPNKNVSKKYGID
jgi:hypothetical protein